MPDRMLLHDSLQFIRESITIIRDRMRNIRKPEDFVRSREGLLLMDGIAMRLQAISEKVKKIERTNPGIFIAEGIDPQPIIRFRDFISHHYEEADYEVLYDVCQKYLPVLEEKVMELMDKY